MECYECNSENDVWCADSDKLVDHMSAITPCSESCSHIFGSKGRNQGLLTTLRELTHPDNIVKI